MLDNIRYSAKLIFFISCILALSACKIMDSIDTKSRMKRFDETFYEYTKYLRWGYFREVTAFMTSTYRPAALEQINSLKNIHISSVKSSDWISNETGDRLTGMIEIDYYISDHVRIRQTQQQLVWLYDEEGKFWQLDAGLPDLLTE